MIERKENPKRGFSFFVRKKNTYYNERTVMGRDLRSMPRVPDTHVNSC